MGLSLNLRSHLYELGRNKEIAGEPRAAAAVARSRQNILNLSRGATYDAAKRGDIKTVSFGRLKPVPTAWLRKKLELDEPST